LTRPVRERSRLTSTRVSSSASARKSSVIAGFHARGACRIAVSQGELNRAPSDVLSRALTEMADGQV
jgi:hypothetical protein